MNSFHSCLACALIALWLLPACSGGGRSEWDNIDYSGIARDNWRRENEVNYVPPVPTVINCIDEDLYNCPAGSRRR